MVIKLVLDCKKAAGHPYPGDQEDEFYLVALVPFLNACRCMGVINGLREKMGPLMLHPSVLNARIRVCLTSFA